MKTKLCLLLASLAAILTFLPALAESGYFIEDSDRRKLTASELREYSLADLGFIGREILARHGFPFKAQKYRDYFEAQDWYSRDPDYDDAWLSKTEVDNVELIKRIEAEKSEGGGGAQSSGDYYIDDSDARLLTKSELRKYSLEDLGYIRNEILARHGYPFKTEKYRDYFESQGWYTRDNDFDYNDLSSTEMKNVELVKKIEQEKK